MPYTVAIADLIAQLETLPGAWRLGVSVTGNLAIVSDTGQVTHAIDLGTGELRPLVGDMRGSARGAGGLKA